MDNNDNNSNRLEFLAIVDPTVSAFKLAGTATGGKITFAFDNTQSIQAIAVALLQEKLLKITVEVIDE